MAHTHTCKECKRSYQCPFSSNNWECKPFICLPCEENVAIEHQERRAGA